MAKEKVKIFVSCHKPFFTADNEVVTPIQVGTVFKEKFDGMLHDDDGDNISEKNKRYCELTAQYYAWKNVDADYYGFMHYRRYLSFADKKFFCTPYKNPKAKILDEKSIKKLKLNEQNIIDKVSGYDAILPKKMTFIPGNYNWYKRSKGHYIRDLDFCFDVIKTDYPEIYPFALEHKRKHKAYMCNMFVLKKEYFDRYCKFLFDILDKHEKEFDCLDYDTYAYRVSGFLSERLFDVFMRYLIKVEKIKVKTVQWVAYKEVPVKK
ncbi:MAG: DUF4422 domain-containing protein [Clostridia bacterium]|nr:DUF4422 domain-containing protein [Clostridia bacterium]